MLPQPRAGAPAPGQTPLQTLPPQFPVGNRAAAVPTPAPQPKVRAQGLEDSAPVAPPPSRLVMQSPEAMGIQSVTQVQTPVDWAALHQRLERHGATCFHLEKPAQGGCRVICLLPTKQAGRQRRVEAEAATQAEAVRLVLVKVEEVAGQ